MKRLPGFSKVTARDVYLSPGPPARPNQQQLETAFFLGLKLRNGTFKTTRDRRMDDLNALVTSLLPRGRMLEILDTAVSSGITTLEWYEHLRAAGVPFHLTAGDLYCKAELRSWGRHCHLLVDDTGFVLQYDTAGLAWRPWTSRIDWLTLYAVALQATRLLFRFLQARRAPRIQPLRLFSPRLLAVPDIELFEDDIFAVNDGFAEKFDVIRAANILNVVYFSKEGLELAIRRMAERLKTGGLLIVNRTDFDDVNNGTVFRLTPQRTFAVEARIGEGSEIEALVLSFEAGQETAPAPLASSL